jgi:hypothetical protein
MKNLTRILSSLLFSFIISTLAAQPISGNDAQENLYKLGGTEASTGVVRKFDNRYEGVKGSPFWFDSWAAGTVILENDQQIENVQLKYNAYEDELIVNKLNDGAYYLPKKSVKSFLLQDQTSKKNISFIKYIHPKKNTESQYYRVIFTGSINLVEYMKVVFEKADFEGGYSNDKRYDEFKKYPGYYYYSKSLLIPQKLKLNPKAISRIFPAQRDRVKKYIIDNRLDCANEKDLRQIFEYYNEIE